MVHDRECDVCASLGGRMINAFESLLWQFDKCVSSKCFWTRRKKRKSTNTQGRRSATNILCSTVNRCRPIEFRRGVRLPIFPIWCVLCACGRATAIVVGPLRCIIHISSPFCAATSSPNDNNIWYLGLPSMVADLFEPGHLWLSKRTKNMPTQISVDRHPYWPF